MSRRLINSNVSAEAILAWLNGWVTGNIKIAAGGGWHVIWRNSVDRPDGVTIEDAIISFCNEHGIDIKKETNP